MDILAEYAPLFSAFVDPVVTALAEQQAELASVLAGVTEDEWRVVTRCEGWDISDVVLHLAQSEMAIASLTIGGPLVATTRSEDGQEPELSTSRVALMVEQEGGASLDQGVTRWTAGAAELVRALDGMDLSTRVPWVVGDLSARSLATTRLAETWIHADDVATSLAIELVPTDRLKLIVRLAWRTLPYAFASVGRSVRGPVAFRLTSPSAECGIQPTNLLSPPSRGPPPNCARRSPASRSAGHLTPWEGP